MSRRRAKRASSLPIAPMTTRSRPSEKFGTLSSGSIPKTLRRSEIRRAVLAHAGRDEAQSHAEEEHLAADTHAEAGLERRERRDDAGEGQRHRVLAGDVPDEARGDGEHGADRLREALRRPRRVPVPEAEPRRDHACCEET